MAKNNNNPTHDFNAFDLIRFAWQKKWILIIVSFVTFIASIIISLSITPRFMSKVTMFPAASVSISKNLVETAVITSDTKDILSFGEDEEAERLLQILNSDQVRQHIVQKFNLMQHYKIDPKNNKYPYTTLMNKYSGNVKFHRTQFLSIEIQVMDEDAQMAADMANEISTYVDSVYYNIKLSRAKDAFSIVEVEYNDAIANIKFLSDSLQEIRSLGIHDYESQAQALNEAYATAISSGNTKIIKILDDKMKIMSKYGGIYVELSDKLKWEIERFSLLKSKYAAAKVNLKTAMSNVFIVDKASKAEKKALPKKSRIVMISTLSSFALALLLLLAIDFLKKQL